MLVVPQEKTGLARCRCIQNPPTSVPKSHVKEARNNACIRQSGRCYYCQVLTNCLVADLRPVYSPVAEDLLGIAKDHMFKWFKKGSGDSELKRRQGNEFINSGDFPGAIRCFSEYLLQHPQDVGVLTNLGFAHLQTGRPEEAFFHLTQAAKLGPTEYDAFYMLGVLHEQRGEMELAILNFSRVLELAPNFERASLDLTRLLFRSGMPAEARSVISRAIELNPECADCHDHLGNLQMAAEEFEGAINSYTQAVSLNADLLETHVHLGMACERLLRFEAAATSYQRALRIRPDHAPAHYGLANVQKKLDKLEEATASYKAALTADPRFSQAAVQLAVVLKIQGKIELSKEVCMVALAGKPNNADVLNDLGNVLVALRCSDLALRCYDRALALKPDFADALTNKGHALNMISRPQEAIAAYEKALKINPHAKWLFGSWLHTRLRICDWKGIDDTFEELARRIDDGNQAATPFTVLAAPLSAFQHYECSKIYVRAMDFAQVDPLPLKSHRERIRVGYFSADFHGHATAYLTAELFERHDRRRFELIAFSFGPRSGHSMRVRLEAAFDQFINVDHLSDASIAQLARSLEIDIAVDLKGFTEDCRTGIFAFRAAPVQVAYLGYPGTLGASFIDYVLADSTVIPLEQLPAYTEKVAYLPYSYQVNDSKRQISDRVVTRSDAGLPDQGFVFCCFNNNYKITPDVFDIWMRLILAVPGSVLWLLEDSPEAASNLKLEAKARGVTSERLIFAPRVELPEHLARQRLADLFLDTLHCNAHTTASDALWVGLPVLTCIGAAFPGRVAASLLRAVGLGELVVECLLDYECLALELATDRVRLSNLRQKLSDNRTSAPLFDADLFARHVEAAYTAMWQRKIQGLVADHIYVTDNFVR